MEPYAWTRRSYARLHAAPVFLRNSKTCIRPSTSTATAPCIYSVEVAERLAQSFAKAEPELLLMYIEDEEREYKARGYEPGERFYHDLLREHMPGFALARYWAGYQEEIALLRSEVERLRMLVKTAADALLRCGQRGRADESSGPLTNASGCCARSVQSLDCRGSLGRRVPMSGHRRLATRSHGRKDEL